MHGTQAHWLPHQSRPPTSTPACSSLLKPLQRHRTNPVASWDRCPPRKSAYLCDLPLRIDGTAPTLLLRKDAFERAELRGRQFDDVLNLNDVKLRAKRPPVGEDAISDLIEALEESGLAYTMWTERSFPRDV